MILSQNISRPKNGMQITLLLLSDKYQTNERIRIKLMNLSDFGWLE